MNNARQIAALAVMKVTEDKAYSNLILNSLLKENSMSVEDIGLCTIIFYGTLDRMVTIDFYLKKLIKTPLKKIKPFTLAVLRTAVYQIKYLEKIPDSAAVNEAVKLIKGSKENFNASFVNGVLRNLIRSDIKLPSGNSLYDISVMCSCPQGIVSMLVKDYGIDFTKEFLTNSLQAPPVFIRANNLKTDEKELKEYFEENGIKAKLTGIDNALILDMPGAVEDMDGYKKGLFFVQDLSCQQAIDMLDIKENSRLLDMCAAPGGKSFSAAMKAHEGEIVSCDVYEHRTRLISKGAERLGIKNITALVCDATVFNKDMGMFDRIICDVPCSGLGVIRRKPDIKQKIEDSFEELILVQRKILNNAANYLYSGGKILYSTCTLNKEENEKNVEAFLKEHPEFSLEIQRTFSPGENNTDGFYAAILVKS